MRKIEHLISFSTMKSNKLVFLFVILGAITANGADFKYSEIDLIGSCPKISYINNLNMPSLLGWYYRAFSTLNNHLCFNNEGQTMYSAQYDNKTLSVDICCRSAATPDIAACGGKIGSGTVTATLKPGEFVYKFTGDEYTIYVLDTDYVNFTIVYGCKHGIGNSGKRGGRDELIFILSRDYELTQALQDRVRNVLKRNGSDLSKAKPVKQGPSTPYTPNTRPCDRRGRT